MKRKNLLLLLISVLLFTSLLLPQTLQTTLYNDGTIIAQIESATSNVQGLNRKADYLAINNATNYEIRVTFTY